MKNFLIVILLFSFSTYLVSSSQFGAYRSRGAVLSRHESARSRRLQNAGRAVIMQLQRNMTALRMQIASVDAFLENGGYTGFLERAGDSYSSAKRKKEEAKRVVPVKLKTVKTWRPKPEREKFPWEEYLESLGSSDEDLLGPWSFGLEPDT
ncbi:hypothetical protein HN446_00525 [bacterium]|nr:hypothetical protein [bacterium]